MLKKEPVHLQPNDVKLLERRGFKLGDPLNSGSFACVCKATYHGTPIAAKVIDLEKTSDDYRLKFLPRELYTMKKLKHRHLIEVIEIYVVGNKVIVFMELADGGDFIDLLQETKALPESQCRYFYAQFGDALRYMHSMGFAHRDIKCENILLNRQRTISKLTDFGFTRTCFEKQSGQRLLSDTYCGSASYVAPEVLKSQPYNPLISDVWSMGVVLYVLIQNRLPFSDRDTKKLLQAQLERTYKFVKHCSHELKDLIGQHLNPNPSTRVNMNEVLDHEWLAPITWLRRSSSESLGASSAAGGSTSTSAYTSAVSTYGPTSTSTATRSSAGGGGGGSGKSTSTKKRSTKGHTKHEEESG